jgi:hypothetical protein
VARKAGWSLVILGLLTVLFSPKIVFPGLELLLGIETLVGSKNVVYENGGYIFTNPTAMIGWITGVAVIGLGMCLTGILLLYRAKRLGDRRKDDQSPGNGHGDPKY